MKIGIIGTRGIPNSYGGFEQFAEFFSVKAVELGHEVAVYCSSLHPDKDPAYKGVQRIVCEDPENKFGSFGQFIYDRNCMRDARNRGFDIILLLGYTSSSVWMHLLPSGAVTFTNMDGLEWKRSKYNDLVKRFLLKAEAWAANKSDYLIADSPAIQEYLFEKYHREALFISYGAELFDSPDADFAFTYGVISFAYSLLIARSEPENNIHLICEAYQKSSPKFPLLIVGKFENAYGRKLQKQYASEKIRFLGPIYHLPTLNQLRHHAQYYFHGHSVGGTNPSLLEDMASSARIIAHDNVFNRAVLQNHACYFYSTEQLTQLLNGEAKHFNWTSAIENNRQAIASEYNWDHITQKLLSAFQKSLTHESTNSA
ncbi:MAG: DUF1972 domain-containing protein [Bacteroidota bacterium]|nr:DUF1972 domain-containing protein [Bacteroidota bacterium]MDX5431722.1 DUF1972 domain-containing protein [Bacteroidota bacterium]MDX5470437.1 DUF1972 domain-containing protein [Bacteroidota bacterium]